jgi:phage tail-like protein
VAVLREQPYGRFNFLVDLGTGVGEGPDGGFQECSPIAMEVAVAEYRNGNDRENVPRKVAGLTRVADVTLKRGLIGSLTLFEWIRQVRDGDQGTRTVTIQLVSEDHGGAVLVWRLLRARPVRFATGPLDARSAHDVAMEELTFAYERLELE